MIRPYGRIDRRPYKGAAFSQGTSPPIIVHDNSRYSCILILFWPNHRDFAKHGQGLLCSGVVLAKWWWLSELAASPLSQSLKVAIATILSKRIGKTLDQLNNSNRSLAWNTSSSPPALPAELGGEVPLGQISTFIVGSQPSHHSNSSNPI